MLIPGQAFALADMPVESQDCPFAAQQLNHEQVKEIIAARVMPPHKSSRQELPSKQSNLCKANLSGMNLTGIDLSNLDLHAADLTKTNLNGSILKGANLSGAKLLNASLSGANLEGANLSGADLGGAKLNGANLGGADLTSAHLFMDDFRGANLAGIILRNVRLSNADLSGSSLVKADLSKSDLPGANLTGANLNEAKLSGAYLIEADLSGASLSQADLSGASMYKATLDGANLILANLTGANLVRVKMRGANLKLANLTGANLAAANLTEADLSGTHLKGTVFPEAILTATIFEPATNPEPTAVLRAVGLSTMRYLSNRHGLAALRQDLVNAGLRQEEREVTYALKHSDRVENWQKKTIWEKTESYITLILFEWPSDWGLSPGRPLRILSVLIMVFMIPYAVALARGKGIALIWPKELSRSDDPLAEAGQTLKARHNLFFPSAHRSFPQGWSNWIVATLTIMIVGFWFSLLTCFHIGWRELSFGTWLSRLQPREYTLTATGSLRVVTGIQSIASVYLLALAAITYFGHPFE
jgi:uncharacterized protein YjbI with pentapeptide repeats